jgi:hypothetical protein
MHLTLPRPCSEKWQSFDKTQDGGFCQKCQTEVIDFTKFSESELKAFFLKNNGKKVCGRLMPEQLNVPLNSRAKTSWFSGILAGIGITLLVSQKSYSQQLPVVKQDTIQTGSSVSNLSDTKKSVQSRLIKITGRVIDAQDKSALLGVNVWIKNTRMGTSTNGNGIFELEISTDTLIKYPVIGISYVGYITQDINIENTFYLNNNIDLSDIFMSEDARELTGDLVVVYRNPVSKILIRTKNFLRRFRIK